MTHETISRSLSIVHPITLSHGRNAQVWDTDGKCYLEIRYGWRRLEVGKGKTTVEVGDMANLLPVLEKIRDAVMLGELDDQLTSASLRLADQLKSKRTAKS